jgi:hypothetical protein
VTERAILPHEYTAVLHRQDVARARQKAREEEEGLKLDGERWTRYREKVAREEEQRLAAEAQERETIEAMSGSEKAAFYARRADRADLLVRAAPRFPSRYTLALEDNAVEARKQANAAREQREAELGVSRMQADSERRCEKIRATTAEAVADLEAKLRTVREAGRQALAEEEEERLCEEVQAARGSMEAVA